MTEHLTARMSLQHIARRTGLTKANTVAAIQSLSASGFIVHRKGGGKTPSGFILTCLNQVVLLQYHSDPQQDLFPQESGIAAIPPRTEDQQLAEPFPPVDIDKNDSITQILDRLISAKPEHFHPSLIATARTCLQSYAAKYGHHMHDVHPPDEKITAQFLAVAPWATLERLLFDLAGERKQPGSSYAWFVAVAVQRIHGIQPKALKQRRAELRAVPGGRKTPEPTPEPQEHPPDAPSEPAAPPAAALQPVPDPTPEPDFGRQLVSDLVSRVAGL